MIKGEEEIQSCVPKQRVVKIEEADHNWIREGAILQSRMHERVHSLKTDVHTQHKTKPSLTFSLLSEPCYWTS